MVSACGETTLPAQMAGWPDPSQEISLPRTEPSQQSDPKFISKLDVPSSEPVITKNIKRPFKSVWKPELLLPMSPKLGLNNSATQKLTPPANGIGPIRIALLLPLSGREETLGRALLDAALIALFEIGDHRLIILPRDTRGTPEGARAAAEKVLQEGVQLILGPVFSAAVAAAAEPARERGVNIIAFSTDRHVAGNGVYLLGFMPDQQVDRVVEFAARNGIWRFGALAPQTNYGEAVVNAMEHSVLRNGGRFAQVERYNPDASEYFEPVKRLAHYEQRRKLLLMHRESLEVTDDPAAKTKLHKAKRRNVAGPLDYQAIMLADGGARLRAIAPLLPFYDIDPKKIRFLGTGLWDEPTLGREPALVGGWFAGPPPEAAAAFAKRFEKIYGYAPPRITSLAYDAAALASVLIQSKAGPDFSATALTQSSGFSGADGIFRFNKDGVAERGLAVIEVQPRGLNVIDRAPLAFTSGS